MIRGDDFDVTGPAFRIDHYAEDDLAAGAEEFAGVGGADARLRFRRRIDSTWVTSNISDGLAVSAGSP